MSKMVIVRKYFLFFLLGTTLSCQLEKKDEEEIITVASPQTEKAEPLKNDDLLGVWKYKDLYPSQQLVEDHFMVIEMIDSTLIGTYYGTTDDFDDSREGYFPGFFVSNMEELSIVNDTIKFKLIVSNDFLFKNPVPLEFDSGGDSGLPKWQYGVTYFERDYVGLVRNTGIEFDIHLRRERIFKKQ